MKVEAAEAGTGEHMVDQGDHAVVAVALVPVVPVSDHDAQFFVLADRSTCQCFVIPWRVVGFGPLDQYLAATAIGRLLQDFVLDTIACPERAVWATGFTDRQAHSQARHTSQNHQRRQETFGQHASKTHKAGIGFMLQLLAAGTAGHQTMKS